MQNIFLIHGYNGIPKIFRWLEQELINRNYNVIMPEFPIQEKAIYKDWKKIFDEYKTAINSDSIVIAHSIGNAFIIKYLQENHLTISLYIGLAGFAKYFEVENREPLNRAFQNFLVSKQEISYFQKSCQKKYAIYSNNDHIVPFDVLEDFPKTILATPLFIENIGHMGKKSGLEKLPEVLEIIENNH